jgi:hypothetical protein
MTPTQRKLKLRPPRKPRGYWRLLALELSRKVLELQLALERSRWRKAA